VLPLVAALAFVLLGFASLATDMGMAAAQQGRLEVAAESAALAAFRAEARFRYGAALGGPRSADGCDQGMTFEACAQALGRARGRATADRVLAQPSAGQPTAEVALGPGPASVRIAQCEGVAQMCWEAQADQAVPLLFGQGSLLGFQGSSLRDMNDTLAAGSLLPRGVEPVPGALRERGVPISSASRVELRRVVGVGPFRAASGLPGRAPFAIDALAYANPAFWPAAGGARTFAVDGTEGWTIVDPEAGLRIGAQISLIPVPLPSDVPQLAYYVPLLSGDAVVGYALARVLASSGTEVVLERLPASVAAPGNASASLRLLESEQIDRYRSAVGALSESAAAEVGGVLVQAAVLR